jgi:hypothetical protein
MVAEQGEIVIAKGELEAEAISLPRFGRRYGDENQNN